MSLQGSFERGYWIHIIFETCLLYTTFFFFLYAKLKFALININVYLLKTINDNKMRTLKNDILTISAFFCGHIM